MSCLCSTFTLEQNNNNRITFNQIEPYRWSHFSVFIFLWPERDSHCTDVTRTRTKSLCLLMDVCACVWVDAKVKLDAIYKVRFSFQYLRKFDMDWDVCMSLCVCVCVCGFVKIKLDWRYMLCIWIFFATTWTVRQMIEREHE